jgi:sulfide dehydrogenase cytochrome subunit
MQVAGIRVPRRAVACGETNGTRDGTGPSRIRHKENIVRTISVVMAATIAALGAVHATAQGSDPNFGRNLAATCANCHGPNGVSVGPVESLAGKPKDEIVRKMQEYKKGTKPATVMTQLAKGYTDEQIDLVAGWFAAQKAK